MHKMLLSNEEITAATCTDVSKDTRHSPSESGKKNGSPCLGDNEFYLIKGKAGIFGKFRRGFALPDTGKNKFP